MKATNGANSCDPKLVRHKYEMLRANALGNVNRAPEFTIFLRNGMSAWMRTIGEQYCFRRKTHQQTLSDFTELDVGMPKSSLASILADAILNTADKTLQR